MLPMPRLSVQEILLQTIQGEGYHTGTPADFIRLFGCPVGCPWCDQDYADGGKHLERLGFFSIEALVNISCSPFVVISGGEPFMQPLLASLVDALLSQGRKVAIETAGIKWQTHLAMLKAWITFSPKEHLQTGHGRVEEVFWTAASEIKLVIDSGTEVDYYRDNLFNFVQRNPGRVFLQPQAFNREALPITLELLRLYPQFRLSLQTQKIIGLP